MQPSSSYFGKDCSLNLTSIVQNEIFHIEKLAALKLIDYTKCFSDIKVWLLKATMQPMHPVPSANSSIIMLRTKLSGKTL